MSIKLNYVSLQNGTMFYLMDLVNRSWTMGLNFEGIVLSQHNLIKTKERTLSSSNRIKICILGLICLGRWEIQGRASIW
jgi:hypothetical protein